MAKAADLELGFARLHAVLGPCAHRAAVPVDTIAGERVAWLCPDCDTQLPAGWEPASAEMPAGDCECGRCYEAWLRYQAASPSPEEER